MTLDYNITIETTEKKVFYNHKLPKIFTKYSNRIHPNGLTRECTN